MAYHVIQEPRQFLDRLRRYEPTDRGHAEVFNAVAGQLINNDAYLRRELEGLAESGGAALEAHKGDTGCHVTPEEKAGWNGKAERTPATGEADGLLSAADKAKLDGIEAGATPAPESYPASAITAGTFPGRVAANSNTAYTTRQVRNIVMSTSTGIATQNGDVYHVYT